MRGRVSLCDRSWSCVVIRGCAWSFVVARGRAPSISLSRDPSAGYPVKSSRRHPSRRQVESATSNSATTAVNSATSAVKSATNALVKSATMIENGNNESLKLRYYYHDGPNTFVFSFYFICNSYKFWVTADLLRLELR